MPRRCVGNQPKALGFMPHASRSFGARGPCIEAESNLEPAVGMAGKVIFIRLLGGGGEGKLQGWKGLLLCLGRAHKFWPLDKSKVVRHGGKGGEGGPSRPIAGNFQGQVWLHTLVALGSSFRIHVLNEGALPRTIRQDIPRKRLGQAVFLRAAQASLLSGAVE